MRILRDSEIVDLIAEVKPLPENWQNQFRLKEKGGFQYEERSIEVSGESGNLFRVTVRRNKVNAFDFSIILIFRDKDGKEYRLVRYNGRHPSPHTNKWEKEQGLPDYRFDPAFHIHRATERYQEAGYLIDGFAEVTTSYHDFYSALDWFLKDNNFQGTKSPQLGLFEGGESI